MTRAVKTAHAVEVDVEALGAAIAAVTRVMRRELQLPIGASSLAALVTIVEQGPIRMRDLATHEGITPGTLTRIVGVLEEHDFIARKVDADDRRSAFLSATPAGKRLLSQVRKQRGELLRQRVAGLSADQQIALAAALDSLSALSAQAE